MKKILYILIASTLILFACQSNNKTQNTPKGDFVSLNNAQLFDIQKTKEYSLITTYEQNKNIFCTILIVNNKNVKDLPKADFIIKKPIKSVAILSSTHIGYMESLGVEGLITGSSNPYRFYNKKLLQKYKEGKIVNIGDDMKCNIESMIALKPDVVFTTGYEYNYNLKNVLLKANIPFIPVSEWKESSILGRTEWVKFFAQFFNKEAKADSLFNTLRTNYNNLKTITSEIKYKPSILWGSNFKGTWYMPGGKSYMGQMFLDAGANYYFKNDTTRGSIHMNIENVIESMQNADYWLSPSAYSIDEIKQQDKHYHVFKALKEKKVFNYNKRMNPSGFNDYWESGIMHPDIILKDIIHILHPDLFKDYEMYYFQKLPEKSTFKREY